MTSWRKSSTEEQGVEGHADTGEGDVRREPLADAGKLPEGPQRTRLVAVKERRPEGADVGAGADEEEDHGEEGLEVEERGHLSEGTNRQ